MATYDPEKEKTWQPPKADGSHDDLGTHPERREAEVADLEKQYGAPSAGDKDKASEGERSELDSLGEAKGDDSGDWETNVDDESGGKKRRFRITGKQAAAGGGIIASIVVGGFSLLTLFTGPLQFIHLGKVLNKFSHHSESSIAKRLAQHTMGDSRAGRSGDIGETRVGIVGSRLFARLQQKFTEIGINFERDPRTGRARAMSVEIAKHPELKGSGSLGEAQAKFVELNGGKIDINRVRPEVIDGEWRLNISLDSASSRMQEAAIDFANGSTDSGAIGNASNKRIMRKMFNVPGLFSPIKRVRGNVEQKIYNWVDDLWAKNEQKEGKASKIKGKYEQARNSVKDRIAPYRLGIDVALLATAAVCVIHEVKDDIVTLNYGTIVIPAMLEATDKQALGSQLQSGINVDLEQYGNISKSWIDENGKSIWEGKALNALATNTAGKGEDVTVGYKQAFSSRNTGVALLEAVGGSGYADIACSPGGQVVQGLLSIGLLITGPGTWSARASQAVSQGVLMAAAVGFVKNFLVDNLRQTGIEKMAGPQAGNLLAFGARASQNLNATSMGGIALSDTEEMISMREYDEQQKVEFQQENLTTRLFDLHDPRSLLGQTAVQLSPNLTDNIAPLLSSFQPSKILSIFSSMFVPKLRAAEQPYDWDFPLFGIPDSILDNPQYQDPYDNAGKAARLLNGPDGDGYIERAKNCFGVSIKKGSDRVWEATAEEEINPQDKSYLAANCADTSDDNWVRIMLFVFDNAVVNQLDCFEGSSESCKKLGFGGNNTPGTNSMITVEGVESPPNLGPEVGNGYYLMPDAPNGEYIFSNSSAESNHYGNKALIDVIYTVAKRWHAKYPNSRIRIGDLNARGGHISHSNGVDVDITVEDNSAADMANGDPEKSKELARMFADTGIIKLILFNDENVQNDFNAYAESKGLPARMSYWQGHDNHFHVRILDDYRLPQDGQP